MSRWHKALLLITLFAASILAVSVDLKAHKSGSTFQAWAAAAPTIDGNIGDDEWRYAARKDFDLGGGYTGTLYVMNDANNLYIAAKVTDDNFEDGAWPNTDAFLIFFDNNNNGVFPEDGDDYLFVRGDGFNDGWVTSGDVWDLDTADGGTQEGSGAMANGGAENEFEISHPLDSADDSHDFNLNAGSTVGFRVRYNDGDGAGFTGYWPGETGDQFGDIVIASAPPTLSAFTSTTPTIDGTMDAGEWDDADTASINFGWTYSGTLYMMNDDGNLYFAAAISDDDFTNNDFLVILFDNDNNGVGKEDGEGQLQLVGSANFGDNFYQGGSLNTDTGDGGTIDGDAKASGDGSFNYYEFTHPLDSADDAHDFSLSSGSTVGFELQYRDETVNYWADWPSSSAASWAKYTVAEAPPAPDFSLSADPPSLSIAQGDSDSSTIACTSLNGFSDAVDLSYSWFGDVPSDVSISLPGPVTPPADDSATSTLQVSTGGAATIGTFTLRVTGTSGAISHHFDVSIEIIEAPTTTTETTESTPTTTETTETTIETTETTTETIETTESTPATTVTTTPTPTPPPIPGFSSFSIIVGIIVALSLLVLLRRKQTLTEKAHSR